MQLNTERRTTFAVKLAKVPRSCQYVAMPKTVTDDNAPLGVGIVGSGFMADVHSRAARAARGTLVGISSSSAESAAAASARLGITTAHADLDALLADDSIDVVHVCTPNATHAEIARKVIAAGKHVVCEKPLATTVSDAVDLAERADAAGISTAIPFVYRYHPMVREARARIARGDLGRLLTVRGAYLQDWLLTEDDDNWRVDPAHGGASRAFADIGSHLVDLLEFVTGDRVQRLSAATRTFFTDRAQNRSVATEDAAAVVIETAGGAIGTLLVSQVAPGRKNALSFEISGSAEAVAFEQENPETLWLGRRTRSEVLPREVSLLSPDAARLSIVPSGHPLGYVDAFTALVTDAYAAIRGDRPEGLPDFHDGVRAARVTDAVLRSADAGAWVDVSTTPQSERGAA